MKKIIQNTISKTTLIDSFYYIQEITPQYKKFTRIQNIWKLTAAQEDGST